MEDMNLQAKNVGVAKVYNIIYINVQNIFHGSKTIEIQMKYWKCRLLKKVESLFEFIFREKRQTLTKLFRENATIMEISKKNCIK